MSNQFQPEDLVAVAVLVLCAVLLALGKDGPIKSVFLAMAAYLIRSLQERRPKLIARLRRWKARSRRKTKATT